MTNYLLNLPVIFLTSKSAKKKNGFVQHFRDEIGDAVVQHR